MNMYKVMYVSVCHIRECMFILSCSLIVLSAHWTEINFMWAAHQVHHSSEDYNLTTALRQSLLQRYNSWVSRCAGGVTIHFQLIFDHNRIHESYHLIVCAGDERYCHKVYVLCFTSDLLPAAGAVHSAHTVPRAHTAQPALPVLDPHRGDYMKARACSCSHTMMNSWCNDKKIITSVVAVFPTKHKDELRWYKTVLNNLIPSFRQIRLV